MIASKNITRIYFIYSIVSIFSLIPITLWAQSHSALPKNIKKEAVLYKNADMVGVGYQYKKQFITNQEIEFFRLYNAENYKLKRKKGEYYVVSKYNKQPVTSLKTLVRGTYFTTNKALYIKGKWYPKEGYIYEGTFQVLYTKNGIIPVELQNFFIKTAAATISGKCQSNDTDYFLSIEFMDDKIKKIECTLPKEIPFEKLTEGDIKYNCLLYILQKKKPVNILFRNGNRFEGNIKIDSGIVIPTIGICKYSTGEIFKGIYEDIYWDSKNDRIHIPIIGTMTFSDGVSMYGDWIQTYDLKKEDWMSIYQEGDAPTTIRNKANRKQEELAEAKRMQLLKEQQKREAELRKKQEEKKLKIARQKALIARYGKYYGELLAQGKLELGMTTAMVNEIWKKDFFDCSESIMFGNKIDIWIFNEDKMRLALINEDAELAVAIFFIEQLLGIGYGNPYQLTFTNGRLTEIIR